MEPIRSTSTATFEAWIRAAQWGSEHRVGPRGDTVIKQPSANDPACPANLSPALLQQRHRKIQEAAYFKAEKRGFVPGFEFQDWLDAEAEVDEESRPLTGC